MENSRLKLIVAIATITITTKTITYPSFDIKFVEVLYKEKW